MALQPNSAQDEADVILEARSEHEIQRNVCQAPYAAGSALTTETGPCQHFLAPLRVPQWRLALDEQSR